MLRRIFPDELVFLAFMFAATMSMVSMGCEKETAWDDPGPAATFETFLMDWYRGEYKVAFEAITPEDRQVLTKPLTELEGKIDKQNMPAAADMLVVGRVDNPFDIKDIDLADPLETAPDKGHEVTLELIYHDGRRGEATMIWGGRRWFVDLPLAKTADKPAQQNADKPALQNADKPALQNTDVDGGTRPEQQQDVGRQQGE